MPGLGQLEASKIVYTVQYSRATPNSCLLYLCLEWFNFVRKYNFDILEKNAEDRPDGVPLVTVCNHSSCLDDPCLWGKTCFSPIICLGNVAARGIIYS